MITQLQRQTTSTRIQFFDFSELSVTDHDDRNAKISSGTRSTSVNDTGVYY
jgi:hypothetical protein